jgi:hypothetical protein
VGFGERQYRVFVKRDDGEPDDEYLYKHSGPPMEIGTVLTLKEAFGKRVTVTEIVSEPGPGKPGVIEAVPFKGTP